MSKEKVQVQVFLPGDVVPSGMDVADNEGRYFRWDEDHTVRRYPLVSGLPSWRSQWQKVVDDARDARADAEWAHTEGITP